jgi:hypothetical protein
MADKAIRLSISLFGIATSVMILLSFLPLATGGFSVDLPQQKDVSWSYSEGMLTFSAPVGISNGGVYDITHMTVNSTIDNSTGYRLANEEIEWGTVQAGSNVVRNYTFSLDLVGLIGEGADSMLFNPDTFSINLNISAKYTLDLVEFSAGYAMSFPWEGLMHGVTLDAPRLVEAPSALSIQTNEGNDSYNIEIPFHLAASNLLPGFGINLTVGLLSDTGMNLASYSQYIDLGEGTDGVITFTIGSNELNNLTMWTQNLSVEVRVQISPDMQFTYVLEMDWSTVLEMIQ